MHPEILAEPITERKVLNQSSTLDDFDAQEERFFEKIKAENNKASISIDKSLDDKPSIVTGRS